MPTIRALAAALATLCACHAAEPDELAPPANDGPLVVRSTLTVHPRPWALELADVDGDGDLDVVVGGDGVDVLLGDGAGGLTRAPGSPYSGPTVAEDFAFGDFDEDGRGDVVVAEHDEGPRLFLLRGAEAGGFELALGSPFVVDATPHVHTVAALDFDGDGHLDVVTDSWPENRLVLVAGRGDGTFVTPGRQIPVPPSPINNLRSGDLDGDGVIDIVTPAHDLEAVTVLLGDGRGGFAQAPGSPYRSFGGFSTLAVADLDRDGDPDVAEVHRSDSSTRYKQDALSLLINDGAGRLTHAPGSPFTDLSGRANALGVGDATGDGWPDVVTLSESTRVLSLFVGGEEGWRSLGDSVPGGQPRDVELGDLDGDGRAEVIVTDAAGDRLVILGARD
jgi:hypothetical protein